MAAPIDNDYDNNEFANAWSSGPASAANAGAAPSAQEPTVQQTIAKERIIKDIVQLRDGLRGLMVRVTEVEGETEKLRKDNEFLGTYIDNL